MRRRLNGRIEEASFKDDVVQMADSVATVKDNSGNARFVYELKVPQFRCYHVSVEIKTDQYTGRPGDSSACRQSHALLADIFTIERTQDWKREDIIFDSLDNSTVNLYFGVWGDAKGTLQWRNWKIEEVGLLNVLRRDGVRASLQPMTASRWWKGRDYDRIEDPHMGNVPYAGEYQAWHEPPTIHTKLPDGTRLRVSWYFPPIVYDGQVSRLHFRGENQSDLSPTRRRMRDLWGTDGYMMSYDEFRCCNWDQSCAARKLTPGQMLAESVRHCTKLVQPQQAYTWNDMFDPFHNAVEVRTIW